MSESFAVVTMRGHGQQTNEKTGTLWVAGRLLGRLAEWLLAIALLISASAHLYREFDLYRTILEYRIIGPRWSALLSKIIPWLQIFSATSLSFNTLPVPGRIVAVALLTMFVGAQATILVSGTSVDCGCFGGLREEPVDWRTLMRTSVFLLVASVSLATCLRSERGNAKQP